MDSVFLIICLAIIVVVIVICYLTYLEKKNRAKKPVPEGALRARAPPAARPADVPRGAGRNVRARMHAAAAARRDESDEEEEEDILDDIALPEGKLGAKKRKKLEMKAEKRRERERELEDREERKQRQKEMEERRKRQEEKEKEEELQKEEEEKRLKEEEAKRELEEYLKLKEAFEVEEEGFDEDEGLDESQKFKDFIDYLKSQKVVLLEDLASRFKLKTQDCIERVQDLLSQETIMGVIDDRGKFIYITRCELESVAQFIKQRGRVSISELVEHSNILVNLEPETVK